MSLELMNLPPEVVREILTYVPCHWNVALVCKDFYEHVCDIEKDRKYTLTLEKVKN
jgi:F-box-like